jgi:DNA-binding CsgD family transcriptional regulator
MECWEEDLLNTLLAASTEKDMFQKIQVAAHALGFDHVAYGLRFPLPVSNPKTVLFNSYPAAWQNRYLDQGYLAVDPTVLHGQRSSDPLVWIDRVFESTPQLWDEARDAGLRVGWAQSSIDPAGMFGMISLARSAEALSSAELSAKEMRMRWLVHVSHLALSRVVTKKLMNERRPSLTGREIEILKWTADGKSAGDISCILHLSIDTVNFHIKNAVAKLQTSNKTAAVVRAVMLGMLY